MTRKLKDHAYNWAQLITMISGRCLLFIKVRGQSLYCHIVIKHSRIQTEPLVLGSYNLVQYGTFEIH